MRAPTPRFDKFRTIAKESHACLYSELDVISTGCPGCQYAWRNLLHRRSIVPSQGDFSTKSLRDFALRAPLEMTYGGNAPLEMASIGNVVSIALTASDISILSRVNADVTFESDVKYAK